MATTIKIKSSTVAGKEPAPSSLEPAELAINLKDQKLFSKDADGNVFELRGGGNVNSGPIPPNSGNEIGDLFFDTTENVLLYWDGSQWLPVAGDLSDDYVKLDDDGTRQVIEGGGGLTVQSTISGNTPTTAEPAFQALGLVSQDWDSASGYTAR